MEFHFPGAATQYGLKLSAVSPEVTATEGKKSLNLKLATVEHLNLAGASFHDIQFLVGGSEMMVGAGSVGQNFLHVFDVEYDLSHGAIRLLRPKGCASAPLAYWAAGQPLSEMSLTNNAGPFPQTQVELKINGQIVQAALSTASSSSALSVNAAKRLGLVPTNSEPQRGWVAAIASIQIAGEQVHNARLRIDEIGDIDMIIGADFFLAHRVYVANSQDKMYFTYAGGRYFGVGAGTSRAVDGQGKPIDLKDTAEEPKDADGFSRRGMISLAKNDALAALADLDRAIGLAPTETRYLLQRAEINVRLQKLELAEADTDRALALKPDEAVAMTMRGRVMLAMRRPARAEADFDAASKILGEASDERFGVAVAYMAAERPEKAISELNR